jgi:ankyrin repeat protein
MGATVNSSTPSSIIDQSALTLACTAGYDKSPLRIAQITQLLLAQGADVHHRAEDGCTALLQAAKDGHYSAAEKLITHGAIIFEAI